MTGSELTQRLKLIGFRFGEFRRPMVRRRKLFIDIEETLIVAASEVPRDPRLFSSLLTWFEIHGDYVLFDKLQKRLRKFGNQNATIWTNAVLIHAAHKGFHQAKRWIYSSKEPVFLYPEEVTRSAIELKGAIQYFEEMNYLIPEGSIRIRESDVFTREELLKDNRQYRNRYLYGASWRADIITAIEFGMTSPNEISKRLGCSYEPAHRVWNEYRMVKKAA